MKGRTPTKEEKKRFDIIGQIGCIVCKKYEGVFSPCEIHHIEGKRKKGAHKKTLGLCYLHHRADQDLPITRHYVSRHPDKSAFERRYRTEAELLEYQNSLIEQYE